MQVCYIVLLSFLALTLVLWMLKAHPLKSLDLYFSEIKYNCWTYDDNIGPNFMSVVEVVVCDD